jgi:hypothetical protein
VQCLLHAAVDSIDIRRDDAREKLDDGHGNVRGVWKVVERVRVVHRGNSGHIHLHLLFDSKIDVLWSDHRRLAVINSRTMA